MAGATKPFMVRLSEGPFTLDETCSFPVLFQPTGPEFTNFFVFSDGEIMGSGPFVGTATNLDSRKTVRINEGGGFSVVQRSDGSVTVTSRGFVISSPFGTILSGHTVIELDANGNVTSRTLNGREENLCAELAGPQLEGLGQPVAARWLLRYLEEDDDATIDELAFAASCLLGLTGDTNLEAAQASGT
jgi:hypothetical protein